MNKIRIISYSFPDLITGNHLINNLTFKKGLVKLALRSLTFSKPKDTLWREDEAAKINTLIYGIYILM